MIALKNLNFNKGSMIRLILKKLKVNAAIGEYHHLEQ